VKQPNGFGKNSMTDDDAFNKDVLFIDITGKVRATPHGAYEDFNLVDDGSNPKGYTTDTTSDNGITHPIEKTAFSPRRKW
jgi:hypothetical protein